MSLLIGFLTFILVVNCLFLMLLVLVQLPKKEAGSGLAFGAGAVDTLIGAGSGNALTKMTKYSAAMFLGLAVVLAILNAQRHQSSAGFLREELSKRPSGAAAPAMPVQQPQSATPASSGTLPATGTLPGANQDASAPIQLPTPGAPQTPAQPTPTPGAPNTAPANPGTTQP